jgi:hypothetical protein
VKKLMLLLLVVSSPVLADELPESIQGFSALMVITEGDSADHLKMHGFVATDALKAYAESARQRMAEFGTSHREYICSHGDEFANDTEALAQYLDKQEADEDALRRDIVAGLDTVVSQQDRITFDQFVAEHRAFGTSEPASRQLRAGEVAPAFIVKLACGWVPPEAEAARESEVDKARQRPAKGE